MASVTSFIRNMPASSLQAYFLGLADPTILIVDLELRPSVAADLPPTVDRLPLRAEVPAGTLGAAVTRRTCNTYLAHKFVVTNPLSRFHETGGRHG